MCTILFSWKQHKNYPLILIANRDEFYERKTAPASWWTDHPDVLGGRDLKAGGTWMGINKNGRFAAITNFRKLPVEKTYDTSRGDIVKNFLIGTENPNDYLQHLQEKGNNYDGFSLIFGNPHELYCYSNRGKAEKLNSNLYGLSNHLLDSPWKKVENGKEWFAAEITDGKWDQEKLFEILRSEEKALDSELPQTGLDLEKERLVSSIFIKSENYGTRISSILTLDQSGSVEFHERTFTPKSDRAFKFIVS